MDIKIPITKENKQYIKGMVTAYNEMGLSSYAIHQKLQSQNYEITYQTIKNWVKKIENNEVIMSDKPKEGRPKMIGEDTKTKIIQIIEQNRRTTATDIANNSTINYKGLSDRTFQRFIKDELGYKARRPKKKYHISDLNIKNRLEWAQNHEHWNEEWKKIVFTDECKLFASKNGVDFIRRKDGEILEEYDQVTQMFHGGKEIMVWGMISYDGPIEFLRVKGKLDSHNFIELIEPVIDRLPTLTSDEEYLVYQQDNARSHIAQSTIDFFNEKNVELLPWPAQSPDLSPIENIWSYLKDELFKLRGEITNKKTLFALAEKSFYSEKVRSLCKILYEGMNRRIDAVIFNKGKQINY
jgi:transposase